MKRFALLFALASALALATTAEARIFGGRGYGNGYYGNGYYGNGYYGNGYYGNGYYGNAHYGSGYYGNGYYGNGYQTSPYYSGAYGYGSVPYSSGYGYGNGMTNGWYGNYTYGNSPWTTRQGAVTTTNNFGGGVTQASYSSPTNQSQWGLRIDEVQNGGAAAKAKLEKGDIIVGVGPNRTQTFPELQHALSMSSGSVELTFFNPESKKTERVMVTPVDGKLGVSVTPTDLP